MVKTRFSSLMVLLTLLIGLASDSFSQAPTNADYRELLNRLNAQEAELQQLKKRIGPVPVPADCRCDELVRLPVVVEQPFCPCDDSAGKAQNFRLKFYTDYNKGFFIRPVDPVKHPFELKINGWIQFRHIGFARDVESWTDNAGVTRPVLNRNDFDTERARLVFSGYALSPRLTYFLQLDGDTEGRETVDFFDYWWGWRFSDAFRLQMGKRKVPGSRQWLLGARRTRLIDRPISNDFFRPDRTVGMFAVGDIGRVHYEAMVGNGLRTSNLGAADINERLAFAATSYWDPFGNYGNRLTDYEFNENLLARLGWSFSYGPQSGLANGTPVGESDWVRLTDGTRLTRASALAPGVTVDQFDVYLLSIDAATRGWGCSINAEAFFRWIQGIRGTGAVPITDIYQRGFYVEGGTFLIARKLDINARYSQIDGPFGRSNEVAAGFNWFPLNTSRLKVSFDVADIVRSPLNNTSSEILVGDDGTLIRTQFQAEF